MHLSSTILSALKTLIEWALAVKLSPLVAKLPVHSYTCHTPTQVLFPEVNSSMNKVHEWHDFKIVHIVHSSTTILSAFKQIIKLALALMLSLLVC